MFGRGDFKGVLCLHSNMDLPKRLSSQLAGEEGPTRQKAARLVVDLAVTAGAQGFVNVDHAHVSGVSVGLRLVSCQVEQFVTADYL